MTSLRTASVLDSLREIRRAMRVSSFSHCLRRSLWVGLSAIWVSGWTAEEEDIVRVLERESELREREREMSER